MAPGSTPAEVEDAAWRRVVAAQEQLRRALAEHAAATDELLAEHAARAVQDAALVRNFRALLPFATRRSRVPPPRRPID